MKKNTIPNVVIVGKPNVGKSAIFNRLANKERALVYDLRGVTRDPISDISTWNNFSFKITDTAGISESILKDNLIGKKSIIIAQNFIKEADITILVFDMSFELTKEDIYLLNFVKKNSKNFFIVGNKFDKKSATENLSFVEGLGNFDVIKISAAHGKGIEDLIDFIKKKSILLGFSEKEENLEKDFKVSFLGRPNVGKSSILNAILKEERVVVSDLAGTTREAVSEVFEYEDFKISILDTAGVRRSRSIDERLEELSVSNTMGAVERSHIVIAVFDLSAEEFFDQDIKLAAHVFQDLSRAMMIVWNKIDLVSVNEQKKKIEKITERYKNIFKKIPQVMVSAKELKNIEKIKENLKIIWKNYRNFFNQEDVFNILKRALLERPIVRSKQKLEIKKLKILRTGPLTISIKTNNKIWFGESQLTYLSNSLRKYYNLFGCPIKWIVE